MEPKKNKMEDLKKESLENLEKETINNLISFITNDLEIHGNFDNIRHDLNQLERMNLVDAIRFIEKKTDSTYSFLQNQFFVKENFEKLLEIKDQLSLSSQEYFLSGIKSIDGGRRNSWKYEKRYIETLGETDELQDLFIAANDKEGGGVFMTKSIIELLELEVNYHQHSFTI